MDRSNNTSFAGKAGVKLGLGAALFLLGSSACRGPAEARLGRMTVLPLHEQIEAGSSAESGPELADLLQADELSLEQLLAFARAQNPGLDAAREQASSRQEAALASGAMPEPMVSWTEFFSEVETRVGPQQRRFDVSQKLPWFGALESDIEAAEAGARAASATIETKQRALFGRIESLLWRRHMFQRIADLELERIALFESIAAAIDGRYRTGKAEYADLLRSRSEIDRAKELREVAMDRVEKANVLLRRELGLRSGTRVPQVPLIASADEFFQRRPEPGTASLASNPDLLRLGHLEQAAKHRLDRVDYERKPDLTVGLFLIDTGLGENPLVPGNGNDASGIKLSLTLPIRQDTYDAKERGARHDIRAIRRQREAMVLTIQGDVATSMEDLSAAERRRDLIGLSLLPRAEEVLDTTRAGYSSGRATYLDLVNAGNSLVGLEIELLQATVDRELARIAIEVRLGRAPLTNLTLSER